MGDQFPLLVNTACHKPVTRQLGLLTPAVNSRSGNRALLTINVQIISNSLVQQSDMFNSLAEV